MSNYITNKIIKAQNKRKGKQKQAIIKKDKRKGKQKQVKIKKNETKI